MYKSTLILRKIDVVVYCWISPVVTFWFTFSLYKYVQGKSGFPESGPDRQVFKIKTDESDIELRELV